MRFKLGVGVLSGAMVFLIASPCRAQSSVTLYGILDEAVQWQSNVAGGHRTFMDSLGGKNGSHWGLLGSEDLGQGFRAIFRLQFGVNMNNGQSAQGGTFAGHQAYVGLSSDRYGAVTMGRQLDNIAWYAESLTPESVLGSAPTAEPGDFDNAYNTLRYNNSIRYASPVWGGFSFGATYSLGGVAGDFTSKSGYSLGAAYAMGPFKAGVGFDYFKNPTSTPGTGFFTGNANGVSTLAFSLNKGYVPASAYQSLVTAVNYTYSSVTFAAAYSNVQYANLGPTLGNATAIFNNFALGVLYQMTPSFSLGAGYDYLTSRGVLTAGDTRIGNQHFHQASVMAYYFLSKRTDVYLGVGWQRASGVSSLGTPAVANISNYGDSSNNHQVLIRAALRHKF
jgi:predicted porin